MKFILKAVVSVIAGVALLLGFLFFYTGGMTSVADDFFEAVKAEQLDEADSLLSEYIAKDSAPLYRYLNNHAVYEVKGSSWHSRNFVNSRGTIAGEVVNGQDDSVPMRIDFIKEDDDWKIYAIEVQSPKATSKPIEPTLQHQTSLVKQSMADFMGSAEQKSMKTFYEKISSFWQSQTNVEELDKSFSSIYNFKGDYNFLSNIDPTIESAVIDTNNLLVIDGYFPMNTSDIVFTQKYIYESTTWKLVSFSYSSEVKKGS